MIIPQYLPIMPGESMASYIYRLCNANGLPIEIFTRTYMGEICTYGQLDSGFFDAERFCSSLPVKTSPEELMKNHTYNEIMKLFVDKENYRSTWYYGKYADEYALGNMNLAKCPVCEKEDAAAGRPGYIHIEHCYPGANRCHKHNMPLKWRTAVDSNESDHWCKQIGYTRNNKRYMLFCLELQKRGAFANRERLIAGLDSAAKMMMADELYINQAAINEEYTDIKLWDTRTGYRGYSINKNPSFHSVNSIPEIMSTLLFLFRTPKNVISYYSSDSFETPENKVALYLRLLTGEEYILKKINTVTDNNIVFTAIHILCGCERQFSMNGFTLGERCSCKSMDDSLFLEYANQKVEGYFSFSISKSVPNRFSSCYECVRYPFSYAVRDSNNDDSLSKEYILQEINRPTLSPSFPIKSDEKLYKETFAFISEKRSAVYNRIKKLKPGDLFSVNDVLSWSGFNRNMDLFILNGKRHMINSILDNAYHAAMFREQTDGLYVRI